MTFTKWAFISLLTLTIGFTIGIFVSPKFFPNISLRETRKSFNYQLINPLLECNNEAISQDKNLTSVRKSINYFIDQQKQTNKITFASVYYRDLNNGPWFGINEKEYFSPASLIKLPLLITYYKESESDPSILQKKIVNKTAFDPNNQNIQPSQHLEVDQEYTVEDLLNRMIIYSDNLAYNLLLDNVDNLKIFNVYKDLDVDISKYKDDPNGNIINVKDYSSFFRILFNASYLNKDNSEKALKLLSLSEYKNGLVSLLPKDIVVAHKFGERNYLATGEKQLHDCGIVYLPKKPYLICIMTRGENFNNLSNFIKQTSEMIYQQLPKAN
jgi:beta-lactamase class A